MPYYPGDAYVDWWSIDLFTENDINHSYTSAFLDNADSHGKPVMIGESTPSDYQTTGGWTSWNGWFVPYFNLIDNRPEIKAFCYINWNWPVKMPELAAWGDCRLESNATVAQNYRNQMNSSLYWHATDEITFRQTALGATADNNVPGQVNALTADVNSYHPLVLSWNQVPDDTGINRYQIMRNAQIEGHSVNSGYEDDGTDAGETYLYTVNAVDKGGNQGEDSSSMMIVLPPSIDKAINGQFEQGKTEWRSQVFAGGNTMFFTIDTSSQISGPNSAKLDITQSTGTDWYMQLRQFFQARQNFGYQVTFKAKADAATSIKVWLQETHSPYGIFLNNTANLTTSSQTFTFSGTSPDDDSVALAFVVGAAGIRTIWIDDVNLIETSNNPDPQNCSEVPVRRPWTRGAYYFDLANMRCKKVGSIGVDMLK